MKHCPFHPVIGAEGPLFQSFQIHIKTIGSQFALQLHPPYVGLEHLRCLLFFFPFAENFFRDTDSRLRQSIFLSLLHLFPQLFESLCLYRRNNSEHAQQHHANQSDIHSSSVLSFYSKKHPPKRQLINKVNEKIEDFIPNSW